MDDLIVRYKKQILYLAFGGATTLINVLIYNDCYYHFNINNLVSNIISWIISVLFAFITNKTLVFQCKEYSFFVVLRKFLSFVLCRLMTGLIDISIMYIAVDVLNLVAWQFKIITNLIVIICNYIASKRIFKERNDKN